MSADCKVLLVLGVSDPDVERHVAEHGMVIIRGDTPGVTVHRGLPIFGFWNETPAGTAR